MSAKKCVTIGGGTGTPIVNEALLATNKVDYITSIAAVFDSGGATGRRRLNSEGQEIAYSDALRILLSLIAPEDKNKKAADVINRWFSHRDRRGQVLGYDIFHRFFDNQNGFGQIEKDLNSLGVKLKGTVLPPTTEASSINFQTKSGRIYQGEAQLDYYRMSQDMVEKIWLDNGSKAYIKTVDAIENADTIFLSCGSFHGSVLCNFLPKGMTDAMKKSRAKKYLITNLVSTRNETHNFTPLDFIKSVKKYSGAPIDGLIVPEQSRETFENNFPEVANLYALEHSFFLGWGKKELLAARDEGFNIITHNATKIINVPEQNTMIVRHDAKKLSEVLTSVLS